jgi:hypothetical protein
VFGPEAREHAFAQYKFRVSVHVIVDLVRSDSSFIDGVFWAK